ncbi:MAG: protein kinase [Deltaproteobacteria bacterium]|nr:protein kinase [Deltaproteobacteria bacterium]
MADSRYRITERVASGGMAEVFRGVAESLHGFRKNIAIKRILPALTQNKKFVAMFLDEARLSLSLQHANIVQVFDIGHSEDTYFIVMEYVDGVDLKALIEWRRRIGKRLPIAASLYIVNEICKGLAYAHEMVNPETGRPLGIVHRDISPPNVLISKQGEVKVVDFGLAKATSQLETTEPGVVKGKMSYLSPEAARGDEVDNRADIFAVGILLYELLTGKRLFYGETDYQTVELVRNAKVPPIKAQNPEVEQELEVTVRKALAKRKEDRYQTATDLQDALAQYSYSRGLKVISRDIADLTRQCLEDKTADSGGKRRAGNILDTLLQDEINKFTSVDFEDPGARPVSPDELSPAGGAAGDFVDPRDWAVETSSQPVIPGRRPTGSLPLGTPRTGTSYATFDDRRPTLRDPDPMGIQAAQAMSVAQPGRKTPPSADDVFGPTPGPETLASVLEPTPGPFAAKAKGDDKARASRTIVLAMVAGLVLLAAAVTGAVLVKRQSVMRAAGVSGEVQR